MLRKEFYFLILLIFGMIAGLKASEETVLLRSLQAQQDVIRIDLENIKYGITKLNDSINEMAVQQKQNLNLLKTILETLNQSTPLKTITMNSTKPLKFGEHLTYDEEYKSIEKLPKDCDNFTESGVHVLNPLVSSDKPFGVFCQRNEDKTWTIIQRRQNGAVPFNRTWQDYKEGFGDLYNDYWLGLERIHQFTTMHGPCELWIEMETFDGVKSFARYAPFSVANEEDGYRAKIGPLNGNVKENWYNSINNGKFSTFDVDNDDVDSRHCGDYGAWWYADFCYGPNLNGIYRNEKGIYSIYWENAVPLKYVHMAIHRIKPYYF